jgi:hypothetical protein
MYNFITIFLQVHMPTMLVLLLEAASELLVWGGKIFIPGLVKVNDFRSLNGQKNHCSSGKYKQRIKMN